MLSQTTLQTSLVANMRSVGTEAEGIANFAAAYGTYATAAVAGTVPITTVAISAGKAAMQTAMVGISAPGGGVASIVAGAVAFCGAVASGASASFSGATLITPPPFAGLAAALGTALAANVAQGSTIDVAMGRIATALHGQTAIGGTATFPGPVALPIT